MDTTMAVTLKSIDSTGVDLKYAYSATKLDKSSTFTGESDYTPQILQNRGDKVYIYILVTPTDDNIPTTFISSVKFWYGQPSTITYNINGQDVNEVVVKGQELNEPTLPVLDNGYSCIGWYSDAEYTQMVDFNSSSRKENLYARYPNLPEDYLAFDEAQQCYYIKRGTSTLPSNLALPSTYKGYNVTYIIDPTDDVRANSVFYSKEITKLVIPSTITYIGDYAFSDCRILNSIVILGDVEIGYAAFGNCYAIGEVYNLSPNMSITAGSEDNGYISYTARTVHTNISSKSRVLEIDNFAYYQQSNGDLIGLAPTTPKEVTTHIKFNKRIIYFHFAPVVTYYNLQTVDFSECTNLISFGAYTFHNCYKLQSIDLSNTKITYIDNHEFYNCYNLTRVKLPRCLKGIWNDAFYNCTSLITINLQDCKQLTRFGSNVFAYCSSLTNIVFPSSIEIAGNNIFEGCTNLTTVDMSRCTNLTTIGSTAFSGCTALKSIDLSSCDKLTTIDSNAFKDCTKLEKVKLPNSLENIFFYAFSSCRKLKSIQLPSSLKCIDSNAFYQCTTLKSVVIPKSVISISGSPFTSCVALESIVVEEGNTVYDSRDNCNAIIETANNKLISGCQNTIIPNTVRSIAGDAFHYCTGLTSIVIPSSIISMADTAFIYCYNLATVYNLSSLNIVAGSEDNGYVGAYATNVYTSLN